MVLLDPSGNYNARNLKICKLITAPAAVINVLSPFVYWLEVHSGIPLLNRTIDKLFPMKLEFHIARKYMSCRYGGIIAELKCGPD